MKDPHTRDSRGFGFAGFADIESATAAKDELQGMVVEGRSLQCVSPTSCHPLAYVLTPREISRIEFAKRNRPRTPTPGQYYGPNAKRGMHFRFSVCLCGVVLMLFRRLSRTGWQIRPLR